MKNTDKAQRPTHEDALEICKTLCLLLKENPIIRYMVRRNDRVMVFHIKDNKQDIVAKLQHGVLFFAKGVKTTRGNAPNKISVEDLLKQSSTKNHRDQKNRKRKTQSIKTCFNFLKRVYQEMKYKDGFYQAMTACKQHGQLDHYTNPSPTRISRKVAGLHREYSAEYSPVSTYGEHIRLLEKVRVKYVPTRRGAIFCIDDKIIAVLNSSKLYYTDDSVVGLVSKLPLFIRVRDIVTTSCTFCWTCGSYKQFAKVSLCRNCGENLNADTPTRITHHKYDTPQKWNQKWIDMENVWQAHGRLEYDINAKIFYGKWYKTPGHAKKVIDVKRRKAARKSASTTPIVKHDVAITSDTVVEPKIPHWRDSGEKGCQSLAVYTNITFRNVKLGKDARALLSNVCYNKRHIDLSDFVGIPHKQTLAIKHLAKIFLQ